MAARKIVKKTINKTVEKLAKKSGGAGRGKPNASAPGLRRRASRISHTLRATYENECALRHRNVFELLIATILSAQTTDERVNMATPALFERYPTPARMAAAELGDLEELVRTTGFYKNKAKSIRGCARELVEAHDGEVPSEMEALVRLPGVGRKTANVILGNGFGMPGLFVDTHVKRLSGRLALTESDDPEKIEADLAALLPREEWTHFANAIIWHGRRVCHARKPLCGECPVLEECPTGQELTSAA